MQSTSPPIVPSLTELRRATIIMSVVALLLGLTTVLPAEYAVDPTGLGGVLGLTRTGELKAAAAPPWKAGFATDQASGKNMAWIAQRENRAPEQAFAIAFRCIEAEPLDLEMTIFTPIPFSAEENYGPAVPAGLSADRGEIVTLSLVPRNQSGTLIFTQASDQSPAIGRALEAISVARRYIAVGLLGAEFSFPASDGDQVVGAMLAHCKPE